MKVRVLVAVTILTVAPLVLGCGNPDSSPDFQFDPEPVTVLPGQTPLAGSDETGIYVADQVIVLVSLDSVDELSDWLQSYEFEIVNRQDGRSSNVATLLVRVPTGSVPDAIELIAKQEGVIAADTNSLRFLQPEVES